MVKGTLTLSRRGKKPKKRPEGKTGNQWNADPRQQTFLALYLDPKSATYSNVLQSGLKAGYTQEYSENLSAQMPDWLSESLGNLSMLRRAERNLQEFLELPNKTQAMGPFGPIFEKSKGRGKKRAPIMVLNTGIMKVKADVTKFVAERIGRKRFGQKPDSEIPPLQTLIIINVPNGKENRIHPVEPTVGSTAIVGRQENN